MTDRPILFSAPMVRALLDGRKTQTRRLFKPQPVLHEGGDCSVNGHRGHVDYLMREIAPKHWCRIKAGDRLWVRESWKAHSLFEGTAPRDLPKSRIFYLADPGYSPSGSRGRPGIHMPRWASRLTLTVTDVRVQRLQDISEEDARAEGVELDSLDMCLIGRDYESKTESWFYSWPGAFADAGLRYCEDPAEVSIHSYRSLWNSINGPGSWDANPWVAAYTFTVHQQNIDGGAP
jgi:hypothetical protein